jgi:hypothetical protein
VRAHARDALGDGSLRQQLPAGGRQRLGVAREVGAADFGDALERELDLLGRCEHAAVERSADARNRWCAVARWPDSQPPSSRIAAAARRIGAPEMPPAAPRP